ncbi:hypothetical protein IKF23_04220, partial [Candidatus Saccharibacteria bacterium]|nr:hypothetical protein [Candidatus Saccharibacteria bacterium]
AAPLTYSVTIDPSLNITLPTNLLTLDLNPVSKTFDTKDLNVIVDTNNSNGYKLTMNTMAGSGGSDGTSLVNVLDSTKTIGTLPIVIGTTSGSSVTTYTEDTFPANKWGYKISARNSTTIPNSKYLPYISGTTIAMSSSLALQDTTTLTFASKVNYDQLAGLYAINLSFNGTINPTSPPYMQNLNPDVCVEEHPTLVVDSRDNRSYYIQRLADHKCWMIQNLRLGQDLATETGYMTLTNQDSNVGTGGFVLTNKVAPPGRMPGNTYYDGSAFYCTEEYGCYYNWYTATAGSGNSSIAINNANVDYSICPKGWRLPTGGSSATTDLKTLVTAYGWGEDAVDIVAQRVLVSPITSTENIDGSSAPGFVMGGNYSTSSSYYIGTNARYHTSTAYASDRSYTLSIGYNVTPDGGYFVLPINQDYKVVARNTRCLLQE